MVSLIIVAGGKGIRMNNEIRKQYLPLAGRPILAHTLLSFDKCSEIDKVFLVAPEEDFDFCQDHILSELNLQKEVNLVQGGIERQDSVYNGILAIDASGKNSSENIVVIHDGVRPFIPAKKIIECIDDARASGACILGIPAFDTLKTITASGYIEKTIQRDTVWLAQTPQAFQYSIIKKAHLAAKKEGISGTDDASLVENIGMAVKIVMGSRNNIKITSREDLLLADAMIKAGIVE